jgi:predicted small secreted protein
MRPGHDEERKRGRRRIAALLLSGTVLSGCSSASSVGSDSSFGSRFAGFFSGATPGVTQAASPTPSAPDIECPGVDIRTGASTLNIAAKTGQATAGDLRYQLSFGQTARECSVQGSDLSIKVGVQGRIILGPMGGPGLVEVPLRYAVVREGREPKTVATRFKRIPVTIAADQTHVQFIDVEEGLTFPMPESTELHAYVVYVGFDEIGDKNEKKPAKSARKPAQRQQ